MQPWTRLRARLDELVSTAPPPPDGGRLAAALALLRDPGDGDLELLLTRRRDDLSHHPGQISFPGGRVDPGETVEVAALREAQEECGLDPGSATVIGQLPAFYIPPSRFWLQVVVARWDAPHALVPAEAEVAEILSVRRSALADASRWRVARLSARGSSWAWALGDGHVLWGATAVVTATLLDALDPGWAGGMTPEQLPAAQEVRPWEDAAGRVIPPVPARLRGTPERRVAELQPTPPVTDDPARAVRADARAGDIVADAVRRLLDGSAGPVVVLAGTGRTGAVGVAAAAALVATGTEVRVERAAAFDGRLRPAALVLDAVTGRGLDGPLRAPQLDLVLAVQQTSAPVVSIDLPSGMHPQRGLIGHAVSADITLVLGAPAAALFTAGVAPFVGDLYLVGVADDPTGGTDPLVRILPSEHLRGGRE